MKFSPMHMHSSRRSSLKIKASKGIVILWKAACGHTLIRQGAVVNPVNAGRKVLQTESETGATRKQNIFRHLKIFFLCECDRFRASGGRQVCSFGEYQEPHGIVCGFREFAETVSETGFILLPFPSHEDYS